ncbi:PREDICTED: RNA-directed DNA polymerase from mobile element jockey-like [Rhagoletis zephyria]|nr:PREDICTED: RNA-directed DNA polymerase from mobile element jockey-like [Rhagoletis zephyria]
MEKIVASRLMWYANITKRISPNQVAYRKGCCTIDALVHLDHLISEALSSKNHFSVLSADFQKAFDRIGAHIILRQLEKWKIGPKIKNFIKSFLKNRKCVVKVNGYLSSTYPLDNGTPQGSPLSACLFIIAFDEITQLTKNISSLECQLYADDVVFYTHNSDITFVEETFDSILSKINSWSLVSGTTIATGKTKILHICRKQNCPGVSNDTISSVQELKVLGLILDSKYNFKPHCTQLRERISNSLNIIK